MCKWTCSAGVQEGSTQWGGSGVIFNLNKGGTSGSLLFFLKEGVTTERISHIGRSMNAVLFHNFDSCESFCTSKLLPSINRAMERMKQKADQDRATINISRPSGEGGIPFFD